MLHIYIYIYIYIYDISRLRVNLPAYISFYALTAQVGLGLLIIEVSGSHTDTPRSVELLLTSDRPVTETSACQHTTFTRE